MKVLIVEEALKSLHGHWFQYISDIVAGGREAGHEIDVAVHQEACVEILKGLRAKPVLSDSVFDENRLEASAWLGLKRVMAHNRSLYGNLRQFLAAGNRYDLIIATTTRLDHLLAYEALHWTFRRQTRLHWALIFIDAVGTYSPDYTRISFSRNLLPLKLAMKISRLLPGRDRFCFFAESKEMARRFETFSGVKFSLVPHVTHLPMLERQQEASPRRPLVLATYGFTRFDKGLDILQSAIRLLPPAEERADMRFVIQWTGDYRLPDGSWVRRDPALEESRLVEYLPPFAASGDYYKRIAATDIMVLPYRKDFYHDRLSRVAIDAALAGIPLVYPTGTWLEWFVTKYASGVAFEPEKPATLAAAIQETVAKFPDLKRSAGAKTQIVKEAFSARTFFDRLTALPAQQPVSA